MPAEGDLASAGRGKGAAQFSPCLETTYPLERLGSIMPVASHLHYFGNGTANRLWPAIVLIHGAGGHHLYWPPQVRRLPNQRIFAPDLPAHGRSHGFGHQRVEAYAQEILEFMKALHVNGAVLVGHSMGGAIALELAIRKPHSVLGLCLVGSGARLRVDSSILRAAGQDRTFREAVDLIAARSFAAGTSKRLKELAVQRLAQVRPSVLHGDLMACNAFDVRAEVSGIGIPTLILCGEQDEMTPPKYSAWLHQEIPDSRLVIVPGAGHMLMLEQPDVVANELDGFVCSIPHRPGE
jgi:pimeloyl-ACP methyl ester carboxylesterase